MNFRKLFPSRPIFSLISCILQKLSIPLLSKKYRNDYQKVMKRKFSAEERRSLLLNQLKADGKIYVTDLMKQFDVSEVSIRKDLAILEEKKLLLRVKGGAVDMHQSGDYDDMTISQKQRLHSREKQLLGKFAAEMISDGETIILDSGTTTMEIAKNLEGFNDLTVITNALDIAITLNHYDRFSVIALGGKMRSVSRSRISIATSSSSAWTRSASRTASPRPTSRRPASTRP